MDGEFRDHTFNTVKSLELTMAFLAAKGNDSPTKFDVTNSSTLYNFRD